MSSRRLRARPRQQRQRHRGQRRFVARPRATRHPLSTWRPLDAAASARRERACEGCHARGVPRMQAAAARGTLRQRYERGWERRAALRARATQARQTGSGLAPKTHAAAPHGACARARRSPAHPGALQPGQPGQPGPAAARHPEASPLVHRRQHPSGRTTLPLWAYIKGACATAFILRSYQRESTQIHQHLEVNPVWAGPVLSIEIGREAPVTQGFWPAPPFVGAIWKRMDPRAVPYGVRRGLLSARCLSF